MAKIVLHEDYSGIDGNDIALLKLASPLEFNDYVSAIPIPASGETFQGYGTVTGWGRLSLNGRNPDKLQKVDVPLVSDEECRQAYHDTSDTSVIQDSMLCAGGGDKGPYMGDSGGPLVCDGKLCGIVSWGEWGYPGVYTEVAYFVDWIFKTAA